MIVKKSPRYLAFLSLCFLFVLVTLFAAGVRPTTLLCFRAAACGLLLLFFIDHRHRALPLPGLKLLLTAFVLLLLQLVPLGDAAIKLLSPLRYELLVAVRPFVAEAGSWLTLDVWRSLESLIQLCSYVALFFVASWVFENEDHRYRFGRLLIYLGGAFALLGLVQRVVGGALLPHLFSGDARGFATFVNPNQAAIFLALIVPFSFSGFLLAATWRRRVEFGSLFLIQVLSCLFSLSRFAIVAVVGVIGATLLHHFWMLRRQSGVPRKRQAYQTLAAAGAVLAILCFYVFVVMGTADLGGEARRLSFGNLIHGYRYDLWRDSIEAWKHSPLFGFGAGAFEQALPPFRTYQGYLRAEHAESEYFESLVTVGAVGFALLLVALSYLLRRLAILGGRRDWLLSGAVVSAAMLPLAISVHFIFEVPAIMMLLCLVLGMLFPLQDSRNLFESGRIGKPLFVGIASLLLIGGVAWSAVRRFTPNPCRTVAATALEQLDVAEQCRQLHPYDYKNYKDYAAALVMLQARAESPQPYLSLALRLNPFDPSTHLWQAQAYLQQGEKSLALRHLKEVLRLSTEIRAAALRGVYRQIAQIELDSGLGEQAEASLGNYVGLGGDPGEADYMRFRKALDAGDLPQAASFAERAVTHHERHLPRLLATYLNRDPSPVLLRSLVNPLLTAGNDLSKSLESATKSLPPARLEQVWGGNLYVTLPGRAADDYSTLLTHLSVGDTTVAQQSRFDDKLQDWVYTLDAKYPPTKNYIDLWGTEAAVELGSSANLTAELFVKAPYKPRQQLQVTVERGGKEEVLYNAPALPVGDGWYSLSVDLAGANKIKRLAFNTGMVSGRYATSSFRIYARSTK